MKDKMRWGEVRIEIVHQYKELRDYDIVKFESIKLRIWSYLLDNEYDNESNRD